MSLNKFLQLWQCVSSSFSCASLEPAITPFDGDNQINFPRKQTGREFGRSGALSVTCWGVTFAVGRRVLARRKSRFIPPAFPQDFCTKTKVTMITQQPSMHYGLQVLYSFGKFKAILIFFTIKVNNFWVFC
jgi:hypothetical protein